jgi:hypothetical protein
VLAGPVRGDAVFLVDLILDRGWDVAHLEGVARHADVARRRVERVAMRQGFKLGRGSNKTGIFVSFQVIGDFEGTFVVQIDSLA